MNTEENDMKIAMIGQKGVPATWGGVEKHVEQLTQRLAVLGHEVLVYTRSHYVVAEAVAAFRKQYPTVRLISRPTIRSKHFDAITHTFFSTLHAIKENVDIYHFHSVGPSLLSWMPRLLRPRARVITTFHSPDRLHQKWGRIARAVLTMGEYTAVRFAHRTITVSHDLERYTKNRYGKTPVYIPNGVSIPQFHRASMITAKYGLEENGYLLVVTRLIPHKGVHHLIRAFIQTVTNKKLVIVGDSAYTDDYVQQLHAEAKNDPRIIFTGYQNGRLLEELYTNCYAYVHPSESEGLSIAILEAGSYGKCILTSDIPSNAEVVEGNGGVLFKNANVDDLKEKLSQVLKNPEEVERSGKQLAQHIQHDYHWDGVTKRVQQLYNEACELPSNVATQTQDA
jgi:glycosyltransferase involved in cell wall biosynthesis